MKIKIRQVYWIFFVFYVFGLVSCYLWFFKITVNTEGLIIYVVPPFVFGLLSFVLYKNFWDQIKSAEKILFQLNKLEKISSGSLFFTAQSVDTIKKDIITGSISEVYQQKYHEFSNNFLRVEDNQQHNNKILRTCDVDKFINYDAIHNSHDFTEHGASILTGVGLLLTFACITYGLHNLNLNGNDEQLFQGIGSLVSTLANKFISSISGIVLSILYTMKYSFYSNKLQSHIKLICQLINDGIELKSKQQLLYDLQKVNVEQTKNLKDFLSGEQFSSALIKAIDHNEGKILPVLTEINERLKNTDTSRLFDTLQKLVQDISIKMSEVTQQQSTGLVDSMNQLKAKNQELNSAMQDNVQQLLSGIGNQFDKILQSLDFVNQKQSEQSKLVTDKYDNVLNNLDNKINSIVDSIQSTVQTQEYHNLEAQKQMRESIDQILAKNKDIIHSHNENLQHTDRSLILIKQTAERLENITAQFGGISDSISQSSRILEQVQKSVENVNNAIVSKSETVQFGYEQLRKSLETQLQIWSDRVVDISDTWDKNIQSMQSEQKEIHNVIHLLNTTIQDYTGKLSNTNIEFISNFTKKLDGIVEAMHSMSYGMQEFVEQIDIIKKNN